MKKKFVFKKLKKFNNARLGKISTSRGHIDTPVFMPVGTIANVKAMFPENIIQTNSKIILCNTNISYVNYQSPSENIKTIGVGLLDTNSTSEFIGLAKLKKNDCQILNDVYKKIYFKDNNQVFNGANSIKKASFVDFIQELINHSCGIRYAAYIIHYYNCINNINKFLNAGGSRNKNIRFAKN